jgi:hypothetical protein
MAGKRKATVSVHLEDGADKGAGVDGLDLVGMNLATLGGDELLAVAEALQRALVVAPTNLGGTLGGELVVSSEEAALGAGPYRLVGIYVRRVLPRPGFSAGVGDCLALVTMRADVDLNLLVDAVRNGFAGEGVRGVDS